MVKRKVAQGGWMGRWQRADDQLGRAVQLTPGRCDRMIAAVTEMNYRMIGIVGGMGPKAGENLHAKILANTRAARDHEHLQVVLYTNPAIPDRTPFLRGETTENPAHEILHSLLMLYQFGAQVLCVPCNTAHAPAIWDVVVEGMQRGAPDAELLHIIELTAEHVVRRHADVSHVGILATTATISCELYQRALAHRNIHSIVPSEATQRRVEEAIFHPQWGIKAQSDPVSAEARQVLEAAALRMIADGAEAVVLGCTEIPLALPETALRGYPLIDATTLMAREAIRRAAGLERLTARSH
jgi:aspartate racemase